MTTQYEPGTVYSATVRGVPNVRVMRGTDILWLTGDTVGGFQWHADKHVTDVHPLVVLDLDAAPFATSDDDEPDATHADYVEWLRFLGRDDPAMKGERRKFAYWVADQIEAQTRPARIPEPGLWGVVKTKDGGEYVNVGPGWLSVERGGLVHQWATLVDPVLVRPGMEDES